MHVLWRCKAILFTVFLDGQRVLWSDDFYNDLEYAALMQQNED